MHDISERKNHEDALSEKNKVLQEQKDEQLALIEEQRANNEELEKIRKQLQQLNLELEGRVQERTAELEYQRQWLYSLFMQVPGLIGILSGEEGTVVLFNKAFTDLWGGRQVHGLPVRQAWPELEGQGYFETFQEVMRTGKAVQRLEHPSLVDRNNDGSLHQAYFNFMYAPYLNPKGETEGVILYGVDVTEQVESRKEVEQSEEKLKLALESGQMGIWEYDPVSNISYHSPLYNKLFGYDAPASNWNYEIFMEHVLPEFRDQVAREYQNSLQTGTLIQETKILAADGIYKWIF